MGFNCGIVGLPNVGKTTIFNALTGDSNEVSAYPFTTTKVTEGRASVPDSRLDKIAITIPAEKTVYTSLEVVDMPGIAKGAHQGVGMGNKFLGDIKKTDAILHVIRCFDDDDVIHPEDTVDPVRDASYINIELVMADLELVTKQIERSEKLAKSGNSEAKAKLQVLNQMQEVLYEERFLKTANFSSEQLKLVRDLSLITLKPMLYIANINESAIVEDDKYVKDLKAFAKESGFDVVKICGNIEADIAQLEDDEKAEFLTEMNLSEPGLNRLIQAGYSLLNLITFFTVGGKENRAWTIEKGLSAWGAAGKIHSDIQRGFIRAEVYHCDDLLALKSEAAVKEKGLFRLEGKEYSVKDGDVLHFRFNV
ncbi:redox-regulated ATPase YchF [bacterium]|nr:redox-regulated ATPase YchF [bacterium]